MDFASGLLDLRHQQLQSLNTLGHVLVSVFTVARVRIAVDRGDELNQYDFIPVAWVSL